MLRQLAPQTEQYLTSIIARGFFASREAAIEAAVELLRLTTEPIPIVPAEHMELVEQGLASALAGRARVLTDADWQGLRQFAQNTAAGYPPSGV